MRSEGSEEPPCPQVQEASVPHHIVELLETFCNAVTCEPPTQPAEQLNGSPEESFLQANEKGKVKKITLIKKTGTRPDNTDHMFEIKSPRGEDASPSSMQDNCETGCSVGRTEDLSVVFPVEPPIPVDDANIDLTECRFFKANKKGPVKKRTSFRKLVSRPLNSNHFLEVESALGIEPFLVQKDGESRCCTELPENVCGPFPAAHPFPIENIDMRTREGRLLKASIKAQVKQLANLKRTQKRPERTTLDHEHEINCVPGPEATTFQQDSVSGNRLDMPESLCNAFPVAPPEDVANSSTRDAHTSVIGEKEDIKKIALVKRARKRPWKNTSENVLEIKSIVAADASSVQVSESSESVQLPESLCDSFTDEPITAVEHRHTSVEEVHLPKAGTKGEVKKVTFSKQIRKRPEKNNLESMLNLKSEFDDIPSSMHLVSVLHDHVDLPENLCDEFVVDPLTANENRLTHPEVDQLPIVGTKEDEKKASFVKPARKGPSKNNLDHYSEMQSGPADSTSSVKDTAESHRNVEHTENIVSNFPYVPTNPVDHLNTHALEELLLNAGTKGPVKKVTFMKSPRKRPAKNILSHPLPIESGHGSSSVKHNQESQLTVEHTESHISSFSDVPAHSIERMHTNVEEELLFDTGLKGAVKKMSVVKKTRNRLEKANVGHAPEIKGGMGLDSSISVTSDSESFCSVEPPQNLYGANLQSHTEGNLHTSTAVDSLRESKKGEEKMITQHKNARKRVAKHSDCGVEVKSATAGDTSTFLGDAMSHCNFEAAENLCSTFCGVSGVAEHVSNAVESGRLNLSEKEDAQKAFLAKNIRKRTVKKSSSPGTREDASSLHGDSDPRCRFELLETQSAFTDVSAETPEDLHTHLNSQMIEAKGAVKRMAAVKPARKRPEKNSNHASEIKYGTDENHSLVQEDSNSLPDNEMQESISSVFPSVPSHASVRSNTKTDEGKKGLEKGLHKKTTLVEQTRKRPAKKLFDQVVEIDSGTGDDSSSVVEDLESPGIGELPEVLYNPISDVRALSGEHEHYKKEDGCLFKPVAKRAVKKMTLTQKPRTGLEKDSERVLQMKSERVDDACYSVPTDTMFRYSVELPESLCADFPAVPKDTSETMDIRTDGGRLCLFTACKKDAIKRRSQVNVKTTLEASTSDQPHEIEIELGEDASSSVLGDSESLSGLELPDNSCSAFPDVLPDVLENISMSVEETSFLKTSQKMSVRKMSLKDVGAEVEPSELDHLFEMKSRGGDAVRALVQEDSHSSFEFALGSTFPMPSHPGDATDIETEEGSLLMVSAKNVVKENPIVKKDCAGPDQSHLEKKMKSETGEDLGSLLHEDSESRISVEMPGSPDISSHAADDMDLSTDAGFLSLFQPSKKVRKRPSIKKQQIEPGNDTSEPLLKRRGRKKKEPEMEILPNGEVRVKKNKRLSPKDGEEGAKPRKRGKRPECGISNNGALPPDGETCLDFGEIFDAVLAEASQWERMKDPEGLARLGFDDGVTGMDRPTAPPLSDNDLYSSADEAEDAFFGYPQPYEENALASSKKQKDFIQTPQVEKRKTSPYFSKRFTEGERQPKDELMVAGEDTLSGYEDASDDLDPILTETDEESEDLDLELSSAPAFNGAGPSGLNLSSPSRNSLQGLQVNCKTVEGAILKTERKQLSVVKNINEQLRRMERHLANLVKVNRFYIRRSLGLTGELVRENASQSLSLQRIAETLESVVPFPTTTGVRLTADTAPTSLSSSVSSDSSDEEWAKRPAKTPKRAKRNREEGTGKGRKKK